MNVEKFQKFVLFVVSLGLFLSVGAGFEGGDGTQNSPYQIATCSQLQDMEDDVSAYYELVEDVNCSGMTFDDISGWEGVLDGNNYVISEFESGTSSSCNTCGGLFRSTLGDGVIKNLIMEDAESVGDGDSRGHALISAEFGGTIEGVIVRDSYMNGLDNNGFLASYCGDNSGQGVIKDSAVLNSTLEIRSSSSSYDDHGLAVGYSRNDCQIDNVLVADSHLQGQSATDDVAGVIRGADSSIDVRTSFVYNSVIEGTGDMEPILSQSGSVHESYYSEVNVGGSGEEVQQEEVFGSNAITSMNDLEFNESWKAVEDGEEILHERTDNTVERLIPEEDGYPVLADAHLPTQLETQEIEFTREPFLEDAEIVAFEETGEHEWEVPSGVDEVDVLVVGGGGAGASAVDTSTGGGGGGGAGGLIFEEDYTVEDKISVVIGDGGEGMDYEEDSSNLPSDSGEDSVFGDLQAKGGGGAGAYRSTDGEDGGSGGGAGTSNEDDNFGDGGQGLQPGSSQGGLGERGGDAESTTSGGHGAGGGGAGEPGEDVLGSPGDGGDGGDGVYFGDKFGEEFGEEGWFAGGGGGGGHIGEGGSGGMGGGGDGSVSEEPESGMDGTGGGSGGGSSSDDEGIASDTRDGGSGIVLVRWDVESIPICDRRGPFEECVSDSSHSISGQDFALENIFEAESTAVFEALSEKASISVSNSTRISGLWQGSFDIQSDDGARLEAGAEFQPEDGRIAIN